jgi:hemolysin D
MKSVENVEKPAPKPIDLISHAPRRGLFGWLAYQVTSTFHVFASLLGFLPAKGMRDRVETEFLPAALEIVETPPTPVGRALAMVIMLIFSCALAWACFGKIDIVATAPGKIVAHGGDKTIQPLEAGVVKAIFVRDGQSVKAGEVLIELDPTITGAEVTHIRNDLLAAKLDVARLHASLVEDGDPMKDFDPPAGVEPTLLNMQRRLLENQLMEQKSKLAALDKQRAQKEAERVTTLATIDKLETTIPYIQQRVEIRQKLSDKELGSKLTLLETIQQLNEARQDLAVQHKKLDEATAAIAAVTETRAQAVGEYKRLRSGELAEAERKAIGLRDDLIKAEQRQKLQTLTSPVDGTVQQLAIHTVGGVVTPAQALMAIVPKDSPLEVEARIANRDIGFVKAGDAAQIKIDTFNFTRYGLRHGVILSISNDSVERQKPIDKNEKQKGAIDQSSEPAGQELVYMARVSLDKTQMRVDDNVVSLTPGMAVTVEIRNGSRSVMSYLLSPVVKYAHDSLRER